MSIMDMAKKTVCKVLGHDWEHYYTTSNDKETKRAFSCQRCREARKVIINGVTLEGPDAQEVLDDMAEGVRAIMYLLDNVEPTCSAESVNGKTVIKYKGQDITDIVDLP